MSLTEYAPETYTDWTKPNHIETMNAAIARVRKEWLGRDWPLIVNGQERTTGVWISRFNPGKTDELIGRVASAKRADADDAMAAALKAFETWSRVPASERARYFLRAAQVLRKRKHELCALEMLEAGKTWAEADGDVCEAIDFLDFYARQMMRIEAPHPTTASSGEENEVRWIPLGVCFAVPPWNFPLAILVGMVTACIVTGNTVILKPSGTTPVIGAVFSDIMRELRLPPGVLNFLPGSSREIGDYLVDHPKTRLITFTGSMDVGIRINERAAKVHPGQIWLKRVIAEMGGKDAMLIDDDCNLDDAAAAIVTAAFGFQGQKCSACSRVIAHEKIHDELLKKIVARTKALKVGPAWLPESQMAACAEEAQFNKVLEYIEIGKQEGKLECGGERLTIAGCPGYYVSPSVFSGIKPEAKLHCDEIFGPVLSVLKCKDFDHGLEIVNSSIYGLTGGVFTNRRENLEKARREFNVGNLYLNRKCTGALVDVQPFGGFNMSGTDDKAGGREHLYRFMQAKTVCERF